MPGEYEKKLIRELLKEKDIKGTVKWEVSMPYQSEQAWKEASKGLPTPTPQEMPRVDAVINLGSQNPVFIEAKKKLNLRALGQIIGYTMLYSRARQKPVWEIRKIVVCGETNKLLEPLFEVFQIEVYQLTI